MNNDEFDLNKMIFPFSASAGKLSWIARWSAEEADVLANDYCRLSEFPKNLPTFQEKFNALIKLCISEKICTPRKILHPIGGINPHFADKETFSFF